ncbi:MAG: pentapeptide repeat-containing protein [Flavobacteriales bacterium]|nr:pentapeptide repeat-containing protein [Flavobacteriales bacterium]
MTDSSKKLQDRVQDLERKLVEQEHRIIPAFLNYRRERSKHSFWHPMRIASFKALVRTVFFSSPVIAVTGGAIGIGTLLLLCWQNNLISEQNAFFREQIRLQQSQISAQAEIRNQSIKDQAFNVLYDYRSLFDPRLKEEALRTLIVVQNGYNILDDKVDLDLRNLRLNGVELYDLSVEYTNLRNATVKSSDFINSTFNTVDFSSGSFGECYFDSCYFINSTFYQSSFENSSFHSCEINKCYFDQVDFTQIGALDIRIDSSIFRDCTFREDERISIDILNKSTFIDCAFEGDSLPVNHLYLKWIQMQKMPEIVFKKCDLRGLDLGSKRKVEGITIRQCNIHGLKINEQWYNELMLEGNIDEASDHWRHLLSKSIMERIN